jgi:succinate dehydrogenase / fumarate reductase, cytochrome b subunit
MSEAAVQEQTVSTGNLLTSRVGSVVALAPLGVWTTWHLWENFGAWAGADAWEENVSRPGATGASTLVSVVVFLPLILHTLWGLRRLKMTKPNGYQFFGNAKYLLQRLSALGLLGFLGAHIYLARIKPTFTAQGYETFEDISAHMRHHPPTLVVYILGVLGTAYHLSNGVYTASFIYGLAASPRASRRMQVISFALFALLLVFGWGAIAGLYQAGAQYAPPLD